MSTFKKAIAAFRTRRQFPQFRRLTNVAGAVDTPAYAFATALSPASPNASGVAIALIALSYSYGFYRSWTLPLWKNCEYKDYPLRLGMSTASGFTYIVPPFCLMKYMNLALRIRDYKNGWDRRECSEQWREWGFYHDKVL